MLLTYDILDSNATSIMTNVMYGIIVPLQYIAFAIYCFCGGIKIIVPSFSASIFEQDLFDDLITELYHQ